MTRIVVVDNGGQWTHREWRVLKYLGVEAEIVSNDSDPLEVAKAGLDGVVLSGGAPRVGLEGKLGTCDQYLDQLRVPIMGICAGHQFMARHFGGEASPGEGEFGSTTLRLKQEAKASRLFEGVPDESVVWESHHDEVSRVPQGFSVLASSDRCPVQAIEHAERPLFGLQFHPEVEHTEHGATLFQNFVKICEANPR